MTTHKQFLLSWLENVYSLELLMKENLQKHFKEAEGFPDLQKGIAKHLKRVQIQSIKLESCIERLNGKDKGKAKIEDKVIKNMVLDYGLGHMEIASYKTLISLALHLGDQETVSICHQILQEEGQSSKVLENNLPQVVQDLVHDLNPKED